MKDSGSFVFKPIAAALALLSLASIASAGSPRHKDAMPRGNQTDLCPVVDCPADVSGLDPDQQAVCHPQDWAMKQIGMLEVWESEDLRKYTGGGVRIAHIDTGYTTHPALPLLGDPLHPGAETCKPFDVLPDLTADLLHGVSPDEGFDFEAGCTDRQQCGPRNPKARIDPHDPMVRAQLLYDRQPGHGTGTLGMLTAPGVCLLGRSIEKPLEPKTADRFLIGVAPGATVIPFRVSNGVIMTEGRLTREVEALLNAVTTQMVAGIDKNGKKIFRPSVDVITMSHGRRSPTEELEEAILTAERNGVIVVAASGEYPFFSPVRFPAQFPTVVGVTGTKVDATPWSGIFGAGRGPSAKVAAPAYEVWHAETKIKKGHDPNTGAKTNQECPTAVTGKGTSFSAPIVAGAAALWLEKYNRRDSAHPLGPLA